MKVHRYICFVLMTYQSIIFFSQNKSTLLTSKLAVKPHQAEPADRVCQTIRPECPVAGPAKASSGSQDLGVPRVRVESE
jgi:hypothetical protein